jgi:hypothetical protein
MWEPCTNGSPEPKSSNIVPPRQISTFCHTLETLTASALRGRGEGPNFRLSCLSLSRFWPDPPHALQLGYTFFQCHRVICIVLFVAQGNSWPCAYKDLPSPSDTLASCLHSTRFKLRYPTPFPSFPIKETGTNPFCTNRIHMPPSSPRSQSRQPVLASSPHDVDRELVGCQSVRPWILS